MELSFKSLQNTVISFEELLALQFFEKEFIFWLNAKDAARLKQCSKTLNRLIKMEDILIENEPLIFRRLVFQKKFDLLEKCIPFRINKKRKYPRSLSLHLSTGFAEIGNLKGIQNMLLQPSLTFQYYQALRSAIKSNQIEIVRFLVETWKKKLNTWDSLTVYRKAYELDHKEISMILFEKYLSKDPAKWKLIFDLILKERQKQQQSTLDQQISSTKINYVEHHETIEYFQWLAYVFEFEIDSETDHLDFLETFENPISPNVVLNMSTLERFPFLIPPRIIKELELALKDISNEKHKTELIENVINHSTMRWSVFIGDFQYFKSNLNNNFEFLFELLPPTTEKRNLFKFVVERTIHGNLSLEFFKHCLELISQKAKHLTFQAITTINKTIELSIQFGRIDLFYHFLSNPIILTKNSYFSMSVALANHGTVAVWKEYYKRRADSKFPIPEQTVDIAVRNAIEDQRIETLDFLLERFAKQKKIKSTDVLFSLFKNGNLDLIEKRKEFFDFSSCWDELMKYAMELEDDEAIQLLRKLV